MPRICRARGLANRQIGQTRLLDAQIVDGTTNLWLGRSTDPDALRLEGAKVRPDAVPGGFVLTYRGQGPLTIEAHGISGMITPTAPEPEIFEGHDVLLGLRHCETETAVRAWLDFHARFYGATAALILDLGETPLPEAETLIPAGRMERVVLVRSESPLGHVDLPPAGHAYNAPAAPGKARMAVPEPDARRSPLGETLIYEVLRRRFLMRARAVLNLDVSDLLLPENGDGVFDRAARAQGFLILQGREAYPWRQPDGREAMHADHAYVQFDRTSRRRRWAMGKPGAPDVTWRITRVAGAEGIDDAGRFVRCMGLRHPGHTVSELVPKTALVEDRALVQLARDGFDHRPQRAPRASLDPGAPGAGHVTVVTCMKNEGPFILEWLAYHRAIGIERFLVYSNDCDDGTDRLLDLLAGRGLLEHRENPYRETGQKPQHAAFHAAESEALVTGADWLVTMDVDEFINVHAGDGHVRDLFAAVPDANMISMTWRLFGNSDRHAYEDIPVTRQFTRCAPQLARKPHQAWGFKTLYRKIGTFRKIGVHRPKGLVPQLKDHIAWVNGSGEALPETMFRNAWRSTVTTYGYDLVTLNHYAVRSAESFLVKRDRGRVNHVDRDQGLIYWFRMNNNAEEDHSILPRLAGMQDERDRLLSDPEIAAAHDHCVARHREKIAELRSGPSNAAFLAELTSPRMEKLSRLHGHFGSGVFWSGPAAVPDSIVDRDPGEDFFFTVDPVGDGH